MESQDQNYIKAKFVLGKKRTLLITNNENEQAIARSSDEETSDEEVDAPGSDEEPDYIDSNIELASLNFEDIVLNDWVIVL